MAKLTAEERDEMPSKEYALPKKRAYPVNDLEHAHNAKGRAKQQLDAGKLSYEDYHEVVSKANAKIKRG